MRIKGALHVHSTLSHDGTLTVTELAQWYRAHGYHFVALGEHSQDMDEAKVQALVEQSSTHSSPEFLMIPGIEFSCRGGLHIFGLGVTAVINEFDPVAVSDAIHQHNGFAVLAHPKRSGWKCPPEVVRAVDAAEIWNVSYDGKFLPSPQSLVGFPRMRQINPSLLATVGHDFHRKASFYDVAIEMDLPSLSAELILRKLREGDYTIRSRFFRTAPQAEFSFLGSARWLILSWQLGQLRKARDLVLRWAS